MKKLLPIVFALLVFGFVRPVLATSPHLSLSPTSGSFGGTFNLDVKIDTGGQNAGGADVYLSFPKDKLRVDSFTKATSDDKAFTQIYSLIKNDEGRLRVFGYFASTEAGQSFTGSNGLIGTINFTVLANGTAAVNFLCSLKADGTNETNDSNVWAKADTSDIIVCTANVSGSYTVSTSSGGSSTTPTLTPSPSPPLAPTSTPPVTGVEDYTYSLIGFGLLTLLTGSILSIRIARERS